MTSEMEEGAWLSLRDAERRYGFAHDTLRRWCQQGKLDASLVGGKYMVRDSTLSAMMHRGRVQREAVP